MSQPPTRQDRRLTPLSRSPEDLDRYEVEHLFHSWSFQPEQAPLRVVSAQGVRFTTEDGRERLDFYDQRHQYISSRRMGELKY